MSVNETAQETVDETSQEGPKSAPRETQTFTCDICGKEVSSSQALSSHVRNKHPASQVQEPEIQTDEDRLKAILKRAKVSQAESIVSIYFSEGKEGSESLNLIMKELMTNSMQRRSVLRQFFQKPISELNIPEFLDEESTRKKGPLGELDAVWQRRLYEAEVKRLEAESETKGTPQILELQRLLADKDKQLAEERQRHNEERIKALETKIDENSQGIISNVNKTMIETVQKFTDMIQKLETDRKHNEELAKAKAEGVAGERPIVTLAKTLDRTVRELPDSLVTAYRKLPMFPVQPQGYPGQPLGVPIQPPPQMTEQQRLETVKRLAEQA